MSEFEFKVQDVYLSGLSVERGPMKPTTSKVLHAQIGFEFQGAEFGQGQSRLRVTTRFRVGLYLDGPPQSVAEDEDPPNLVGVVETRYTANIDSSRDVSQEDAEAGVLDPALEMAVVALHPYHRAAVESHTALLGVSPLRLPVDWTEVAENLAASAQNLATL